jgi:hypothetical protein
MTFGFAFRHNLGSYCLNDPSLHSKTLNLQNLVLIVTETIGLVGGWFRDVRRGWVQTLGQPEYCEPLAEEDLRSPQPVVVSPTPLTSNKDRLYRHHSPKDDFAAWDENAWAPEETVTDEGGTCHHLP